MDNGEVFQRFADCLPERRMDELRLHHGLKPEAPNYQVINKSMITCMKTLEYWCKIICYKNPQFLRKLIDILLTTVDNSVNNPYAANVI